MQSNNNSQVDVTEANEREFNLFELVLMIKTDFLPFVIISLIGISLSVAVALNRAKIYEASIELSKPSEADIIGLNLSLIHI